jgi:ATP-dependent Lhr-like helicase
MLDRYLAGYSGLLNAPTGSGKTLAMWLPILIDWMSRQPDYRERKSNGLQVLWITPLRALAKDAVKSMRRPQRREYGWRHGPGTSDHG